MTIRSKLLASALIPVMAGWLVAEPVLAAANEARSFEVAQANGDDEQPPPKRKKREADAQDESREEQPRRKREAAQDDNGGNARPRRDAGDAANEEQPRKRRQEAADQQDDNGGNARPRPAAGDDNGEQPRKPRKKAEEAQADDNGGNARPRPAANDDNGDQPRKPKKADAEQQDDNGEQPRKPKKADAQADDNGGNARPRPAANDDNGDQPRKPKKADAEQQDDNGEQPRKPKKADAQADDNGGNARPRPAANDDNGDQPRKPKKADAAQQDDNGDQPRKPKKADAQADDNGGNARPRPAASDDNSDQPRKPKKADAAQQDDNGEQPRKPKKADAQADDNGGNARPRPAANDDNGDQPRKPKKADAAQPDDNGDQPRKPKKAEDAQQRNGATGVEIGRRPQPDDNPQVDNGGRNGARPRGEPAPEIIDRRSDTDRREQAKDPSKTDDTVVLPVENGAAVLDSDKDADNRGGQDARDDRRRKREQDRAEGDDRRRPPRSDADAQSDAPRVRRQDIDARNREEGRRRDRAPDFFNEDTIEPSGRQRNNDDNDNVTVIRRFDDRTVYETDDGIVVRNDERPRLRRDSQESYYDDLAGGRVRETIVRPNGARIVTIYNRYGDVIQRSRVGRNGEEYLMMYAPEADVEDRPPVFHDPGDDLPPMRLRIPVQDYIIDTSTQPDRDYYDFLAEPPVEPVERVYTMDEVKYSARLRDKVRRIDLDTITFATGSAEVPMAQARTLRSVAEAIQKVLDRDPGETFLIEGHTDAVGSDESNLVLSDQRAESVAEVLTDVYGIPPENLTTQGYGERYLKVRTSVAEQQNRRVTIRRVTSLVRPATAQQ